jgi:hypothetical protein
VQQEDAARVVLVRALEETIPDRIPPEALLEAHAAAGDPVESEAWIARRARYLVDHALGSYRTLLEQSRLVLPGPWLSIGVAVLLGVASNYLGPSRQIHVVWNPIVVLMLWNLAVYAGLAAMTIRPRSRRSGDGRAHAAGLGPQRTAAGARPAQPAGLADRLLFGIASRWIAHARERVDDRVGDAKATAAVGRRFARLWWPTTRPALGLWVRRLLHLMAIGVTIGAVLGMYVRGLFFAYRVVWQSTFVNDPGAIAFVLRALLGPAALVLREPLPGPEDVVRLLGDTGDPAAGWIHLYAVSALLVIVIPRALLAVAATRRLRRRSGDVSLDLDQDYFQDLLRKASAVSPDELERSMRDAVNDECRRFADRLAGFVGEELYDRRIMPRLRAFRDEGGTIRELESTLQGQCEAFAPVLLRELPAAERELERALVLRIQRLVGDESILATRPAGDLVGRVSGASSRAAVDIGEEMSDRIGATVGGVVSASVAAAVGTVSGGFGEALGIALLAEIGVSGPVGWVVGAAGALIAAGAAYWLGRARLREGIKGVRLPPAVLKVALWPRRYERTIAEGRERCQAAVRQALETQLAPLSSAIADHIWRALKPVVGELQRPRVSVRDPGSA